MMAFRLKATRGTKWVAFVVLAERECDAVAQLQQEYDLEGYEIVVEGGPHTVLFQNGGNVIALHRR